MKTGIEMIAAERERQITAEGWTPEKEDSLTSRELSRAALCHLSCQTLLSRDHIAIHEKYWPFSEEEWFDPRAGSRGRIGELARAGALIAAEIDRLQRLGGAQ